MAKVWECSIFRDLKGDVMSVNNPREVFVLLLSDVRRKTERSMDFFKEISKLAEEPEIKEAIEARAFITEKSLEKIDQAFKLINEKPVSLSGRLEEIFVEDFRREVAAIKAPLARRLFVLAKLIHLSHFRVGEYIMLVNTADVTGHFGVGVLLESCLADNLAFVERTRRIVRRLAEARASQATA
jgi:ferritin-like metal-binding protein YciE